MTEPRRSADLDQAPHELPARLDAVLARWIAGGDPPSAEALGEGADAATDALALLAVAGQCRQFLLDTPLPRDARPGPDWPAPTLPLLPDALRPRFRRTAKAMHPVQRRALLRLLDARGWMAHPFDWRPGHGDDDLPAAYDGWRRRAGSLRAQETAADDETLDAASPGERRRQLTALRTQDPAAARARIAALLPALPAEQRLALVEQVLALSPTAEDLPLLDTLSADRSERVRSAAARLRARLGVTQPLQDEERADIRAWFEVGSSGLLKRRPKVSLLALKTRPQQAARRERLQRLGWMDLCAVLEMDPAALLAAWVPGDQDDDLLLECAAHTLPAEALPALVERLLFDPALQARRYAGTHAALSAALARLDPAARRERLAECFARQSAFDGFFTLLDLADAPLPALDLRTLQRSPFWDGFGKALRAHLEHGAGASAFAQECASLACLLAPPAAQALLGHLTEAGVPAGDPALDALTLAAELPPAPAVPAS